MLPNIANNIDPFVSQFESIVTKSPTLVRWHNTTVGFWVDAVLCKIFVTSYFGFAMIPFTMLKYRNWGPVYRDLYYNGLLVFGAFPAYAPIIKQIVGYRPTKKSSEKPQNGFAKDHVHAPESLEKANIKAE